MGLYFSKLYDFLRDLYKSQPRRMMMRGLDAAGKTTILYKLKRNEYVTTIPTIGLNVEEVKIAKGSTFIIFDIGGGDKFRRIYQDNFQNSQALIYVVDSNDAERLTEAKEELFSILDLDNMREVPVIVMANKQDLPNAMSPSRIEEGLELTKLDQTHKWHLQGCSAFSGDGLYEAMEMVGRMSTDYIKASRNRYICY